MNKNKNKNTNKNDKNENKNENYRYVDFVRFIPKKQSELFEGFDLAVCFQNSSEREKNDEHNGSLYPATLVRADDVVELKKKLRKAKGFIGVLSSETKVNREAIMRRKVHVILDSEERKLDYASIKLAAEKDVVIEVSFSKFLRTRGFKRMKLLDETRLLLKLLMKFGTPFLITSGAEKELELRPRYQLYGFFSLLARDAGLDELRFLESLRDTGTKICRMLTDSSYILNGVEVERLLNG